MLSATVRKKAITSSQVRQTLARLGWADGRNAPDRLSLGRGEARKYSKARCGTGSARAESVAGGASLGAMLQASSLRRSARSQAVADLQLERAVGCGLIASRRSNSAHLHRPWRAIGTILHHTARPRRRYSAVALESPNSRFRACNALDVKPGWIAGLFSPVRVHIRATPD